jgi:dGTPase
MLLVTSQRPNLLGLTRLCGVFAWLKLTTPAYHPFANQSRARVLVSARLRDRLRPNREGPSKGLAGGSERRGKDRRRAARPPRKSKALYSADDIWREVAETDFAYSGTEYRSCFRRDYARLLHSPPFRRLQGKTQLFPGFESDFFRTRLTHSLEVAQIAKSIALRLNQSEADLRNTPIDLDLVEFAGLAHDLGHPPFGHNGEHALDERMKGFGGFEGNAQTFRILSRVEKKRLKAEAPAYTQDTGLDGEKDYRAGLNLTARSLAGVLKYDHKIDAVRTSEASLDKGYYFSEEDLVASIKQKVLGTNAWQGKFKTIECSIMDLADDVAYSTYDLEDALKVGFLSPLEVLSLDDELSNTVAEQVSKSINSPFTASDVRAQLIEIFSTIVENSDQNEEDLTRLVHAFQKSRNVSSVGYLRTELTSQLVGEFIAGVQFEYNKECPPLSRVYFDDRTLRRVETLKRLTFNAVILSPRLKVAEYRGFEIVTSIFDALVGRGGVDLLPQDVRRMVVVTKDELRRKRIVCDFVAGMTDAYAIEFYARLKSENARTIFKPF